MSTSKLEPVTLQDGFSCILCRNGSATFVHHLRDDENRNAYKCTECGHIQMFPLLTEAEEKEEYDQDKTVRFGGIAPGADFESMRKKFREWTKQHADMYFEKLNQHNNVLELASGYGFFMENLNNRPDKKFNIEGIEIGEFRLNHFVGGKVHNLNLYTDSIPDDMREKYDLVISMHLLEHLSDPIDYLQKIKPLLTKNEGKVLFEVPNLDCWLASISPEYYAFMFLYEHCSYYTKDTLRFVFEQAGYEVLSVYTKEIYSIENHINWIRNGKPFTAYNQMFLSNGRLEWINEEYKKKIGQDGNGFSLIIEAKAR